MQAAEYYQRSDSGDQETAADLAALLGQRFILMLILPADEKPSGTQQTDHRRKQQADHGKIFHRVSSFFVASIIPESSGNVKEMRGSDIKSPRCGMKSPICGMKTGCYGTKSMQIDAGYAQASLCILRITHAKKGCPVEPDSPFDAY